MQVRKSAVHRQDIFGVRFDWARTGAEALVAGAGIAVVVDVLSFTTTVSVALDAGARVLPYAWRDDSAAEFARQHGAVLAVGRSRAGSGQVTLSPAGMRAHAPAGGAVVLPSPNGSAIARALAGGTAPCVAACLRNAGAVAGWIAERHPDASVLVVAAGERWPDGTLRPAVEDLWGAGAVISALHALGRQDLSPEADAARAAYDAVRHDLTAQLHACASGRELDAIGFGDDVDVAAELDTSTVVPVLRDDAFVDAH